MKFYQIVEELDNEIFKPLVKFYDPTKAKMRLEVYQKTYPDRIFKIFVRNN
jgi:hypothetical protein